MRKRRRHTASGYPVPESQLEIERLDRESFEAGMTYGEYVARTECPRSAHERRLAIAHAAKRRQTGHCGGKGEQDGKKTD